MDRYLIEKHKIFHHISRLNSWLNDEMVYPIYMEISPSGTCNHRCTFCGLDFMGYHKRFLDVGILEKTLQEMGQLGVKSVMYAGEGEPLLHREIGKIIRTTKKCGIDVAVSTNGVCFYKSLAEEILDVTEWIKVSIDAGTSETYARIHQTGESDFNKVITNFSQAVEIKHKFNYECTMGIQMLLLPENADEAVDLAELSKNCGADYLVIKPYSHHPMSRLRDYDEIYYENYLYLSKELSKFNTDSFEVIFRTNTMKKWDDSSRNYDCCQALPFWTYMDASGNIWGCSAFLGDPRFKHGNINQKTFREIWEGTERALFSEWVEKNLDTKNCRVNCRMDEVNRYLWSLKNPPAHVNFI